MNEYRKQVRQLKANLSELATNIHNAKTKRKGSPNGVVPGLFSMQTEARTKHIAYCLLRGRTIEQIEPKLRDPSMHWHLVVRENANRMVEGIRLQIEASKISPIVGGKVNGVEEIVCPSRQDPISIPTNSSMWSRITNIFQ